MKKIEEARRRKKIKKWMAAKRRWNKDHPVEYEAREKVFAAERLVRIEKRNGKVAMNIEKRKQKHERYLKRKAENKPGMFKRLIVKFSGDKENTSNLDRNRVKNKLFQRKTG